MFVSQENWEDCKKYFEGCWVKFKEEGDNKIWNINEVNTKYIVAQGIDKETIGIDLSVGYTIDYVIPKKTTFQLGEEAVNLSRIPARQWKKGMNKQNTLFSHLSAANGWINGTFNPQVINGFVNKPTYYSYKDAEREFKKSEHLLSAALDPRIAVTRLGAVYIDSVMVAKWNIEKESLVIKKIFVPEIAAVFPNIHYRVVK